MPAIRVIAFSQEDRAILRRTNNCEKNSKGSFVVYWIAQFEWHCRLSVTVSYTYWLPYALNRLDLTGRELLKWFIFLWKLLAKSKFIHLFLVCEPNFGYAKISSIRRLQVSQGMSDYNFIDVVSMSIEWASCLEGAFCFKVWNSNFFRRPMHQEAIDWWCFSLYC